MISSVAVAAISAGAGCDRDRTPPRLISFGVAPTLIEVTKSDKTVTVTMEARDNRVLLPASVTFEDEFAQVRARGDFIRISGNSSGGLYEAELEFEQESEATWHVPRLLLRDSAGNRRHLTRRDLDRMGFPTELAIRDISPPELVRCRHGQRAFGFSPTFIDVTESPKKVIVTMCVTDNFSGFMPTPVTFEDEFGRVRASGDFVRISDDALDVTYEAELEFTSDRRAGLWRVAEPLILLDKEGNAARFTRKDLAALSPPSPAALHVVVADIEVSPVVLDFGDLNMGLRANQVVTIANLGGGILDVTGIELDAWSDPDFAISTAPELAARVQPNQGIDVEILFRPATEAAVDAILRVTSNDPDQALVEVVVNGSGVSRAPPNVLGPILDFFADSVATGRLTASGSGPFRERRLAALWSTLEGAGDLLKAGEIDRACNQLLDTLLRTEGVFPAPRFVAGPATLVLAEQMEDVWTRLGCDVRCGDVDRSGALGPEDVSRARDYLVRTAPEPPFELARCSVSGQTRTCDVRDVARMRRATANLPAPLENICPTAAAAPAKP